MSIANAEQIGGVAVGLGLDDSAFRSGLAKAKQFAEQEAKAIADVMRQQLSSIHVSVGGAAGGTGGGVRSSGTSSAVFPSIVGGSGGATISVKLDASAFTKQLEGIRNDLAKSIQSMQSMTTNNPVKIRTELTDRNGRPHSPGGHGDLSKKNLLSLRGLETAGLVGTATAAYAIVEGIRLTGEAAEAIRHSMHPEKVMRQYDQGGALNHRDAMMIANTSDQAVVQGKQMFLQSVESIPLIGSLVKIGDSLVGLSASLEDDAARLKRNAEIHVAAVESMPGLASRFAVAIGAPVTAAQIRAQDEYDRSLEDIRRTNGDPAVVRRHRAVAMVGQIELNRANDAYQANLIDLRGRREIAKIEQQATSAELMGDGERAYALRRTATIARATTTYEQTVRASQNDVNGAVIREAAAAERDAAVQQQVMADTRRRRERGYRLTELRSSAESAGMRAEARPFAADLHDLDTANEIRLRKMRHAGEREDVIAAERENMNAQRRARVAARERELEMTIGDSKDRAAAASLKQSQNYFDAEMRMVDGHYQRRIKYIEDASEKQATIEEYQATKSEMIAAHKREMGLARLGLFVRQTQAGLIQDTSLPLELQKQRGELIGMGASLFREIIEAPRELKGEVKRTAIEELKAKKSELTRIEGGTMASEIDVTANIVGDPLGITGFKQRRKILGAEIDRQIKMIEGMNLDADPAKASVDLLKGIHKTLGDILEKAAFGSFK